MGPAPSRFRNDDQEQAMRTVANENEIAIGSTDDRTPTPTLTDSTGLGIVLEVNKVSTNENWVDIPRQQTHKFTKRSVFSTGNNVHTQEFKS